MFPVHGRWINIRAGWLKLCRRHVRGAIAWAACSTSAIRSQRMDQCLVRSRGQLRQLIVVVHMVPVIRAHHSSITVMRRQVIAEGVLVQLHAVLVRVQVPLTVLAGFLNKDLLVRVHDAHKALVRINVPPLRVHVHHSLLLPLAQAPVLALLIDLIVVTGRHLVVHHVLGLALGRQFSAETKGVRNETIKLPTDWARGHRQGSVDLWPALRQPPFIVKVHVIAEFSVVRGRGSRADLELKDVSAPLLDLHAVVIGLSALGGTVDQVTVRLRGWVLHATHRVSLEGGVIVEDQRTLVLQLQVLPTSLHPARESTVGGGLRPIGVCYWMQAHHLVVGTGLPSTCQREASRVVAKVDRDHARLWILRVRHTSVLWPQLLPAARVHQHQVVLVVHAHPVPDALKGHVQLVEAALPEANVDGRSRGTRVDFRLLLLARHLTLVPVAHVVGHLEATGYWAVVPLNGAAFRISGF